MDSRPQPPTHLKPPPPQSQPHHQNQPHQQQQQQSHHHRPSNPASTTPTRPPLAIHPSAQISDTTIFQGTHPISIGAHTIIHPRARLYSHEGPILISNNCIISEKTVIGTPAPFPGNSRPGPSTTATTTTSESTAAAAAAAAALPIRISSRVTIGPAVSIAPGAHIHSGVVIDALAVINRRVDVGAHARVCAGCEVAAGTGVGEWVVVWGGGGGGGQRRRRRETRGVVWGALHRSSLSQNQKVDGGGERPGDAPLEARTLEDARLMVLDLEREAVGRLLVAQNRRRG